MRGSNNMSNEMAPRARGWISQAIVVAGLLVGLAGGVAQAAMTEVYRFYHLDAGRHFYTANADERDKVLSNYPRFAYEGVAFFAYPAQDAGTIPVYRFYHGGNGSHVYTASEAEKASILVNFPIYAYEGVAFYAEASAASGAIPLYRLYNTKLGTHFFTTSGGEANSAVATWPWFANEGSVFFVRPGPGQPGNGANIAPSASLSVATTDVKVGDVIALTADVSDPDGTVAKVDYFLGPLKIGTTLSPPHKFNYVATAQGSMSFSVVATDNAALSGASNAVVVSAGILGTPPGPPSNTPPTVTLVSSATSVAAGTSITLTANAFDANGSVARVLFYVGATQILADTTSPFAATYTPSVAGTYSFSAVAVDNQNAQTSSNAVMVQATAGAPGAPNTPPTVSLVTSTGNLSVGGNALLTATATDTDGSVAKVEFYQDSLLIGTDTSSPFTVSYTASVKGNFSFKAVATDNKGATSTSNPVAINVAVSGGGNNPPVATLAASSMLVAAGGVSVLTANATDRDGSVAKVVFYDGTTVIGQSTTSPFKHNFSSSTSGIHVLKAVAHDNLGATTTTNTVVVFVTGGTGGGGNAAPTVSLAATLTSISTGAVSKLTATAADSDGTIAKVVFYNGPTLLGEVTKSPYTYDFTSNTAGSYTLTAVAFDNQNAQTTSSPVAIQVKGGNAGVNKPPTVDVVATATTVVAGMSTTLTAHAADIDGSIASVAFFNGTTQVSLDTTAPYMYTFTPGTAGSYALKAEATDDKGAKTMSNVVTVTATVPVVTGNPTISLAMSASLVTAPATVTLTGSARATATGTTLVRVSFFMNGAKIADVPAVAGATVAALTFPAPIGAPGTYVMQAQVTDSAGNIASTMTQVITAGVPATINTTSADTWRLLNQATFGASQAEAARVNTMGVAGWINDQLTKPISGYPDAKYNRVFPMNGPAPNAGTPPADCTDRMPSGANYPADAPQAVCYRDKWRFLTGVQRDFFTNAVGGSDQLRQRVAWALSQILVTSANESDLEYAHVMAKYQNMMFQEAFGNYETLLKKVTYNPAMGNYLDSVNNDKPSGTRMPNENYAREILQLFTIGLHEMDASGNPILDANGVAVPTYDEADIVSFSRTFTGLTYSTPANPAGTPVTSKTGNRFYGTSMIPYVPTSTTSTIGHDTDVKTLLNGTQLPAGQGAIQDIDAAVLNAFMHPNTGPFVSRQLIQRLVTGNPSADYVGRVAAIFNNNGAGARGDLAAVVKTILLDPEARGGAKTAADFGQLKEPVLMVTNLIRALSGVTDGNALEGATANLGQRPYFAPTVFNYFPPDNTIAGTMILGPEFAIHTTQTAVARANLVYALVYNQGFGPSTSVPDASGTRLYVAQFETLADNPVAMVSQINKVLAGGQFPAAQEAKIVTAVNAIAPPPATLSAADRTARARMAVYLMGSSYDYQVQR